MTQDGYRKGTAKRKFTAKDVPWLRKMIKEVKSGILSQEGDSNKYKVTRHQARKLRKRKFSL